MAKYLANVSPQKNKKMFLSDLQTVSFGLKTEGSPESDPF
jgi:hypothetical protein